MSRDKNRSERRCLALLVKATKHHDRIWLNSEGCMKMDDPDLKRAIERGWFRIERERAPSFRGGFNCQTYAVMTDKGRAALNKETGNG